MVRKKRVNSLAQVMSVVYKVRRWRTASVNVQEPSLLLLQRENEGWRILQPQRDSSCQVLGRFDSDILATILPSTRICDRMGSAVNSIVHTVAA